MDYGLVEVEGRRDVESRERYRRIANKINENGGISILIAKIFWSIVFCMQMSIVAIANAHCSQFSALAEIEKSIHAHTMKPIAIATIFLALTNALVVLVDARERRRRQQTAAVPGARALTIEEALKLVETETSEEFE